MGFRYQQRANEWWSDIDGRTHAERAFHRALSLNESLLPALWHLSAFYVETGEFDRAAEFIRRMFRVTQKSAMAHYALGYLYRYLGLLDESVREVELALSIDPRNPRFRSAALTYFYNADYAKAYETLGLAGDSTLSLAWMGTIDFVRGDTARSLANLDRAIAMNRESYIGRRHAAIRAHILGVPDEARREMQELEAIARHDVDSEHWYLLGNVYALLGDAENCARCVRRGAARGFLNYPGMLKDPFLDRVRDEPVVVQALALVREKHEHFKNTFAFANEES
jgi:tetratricopeptide (TPR) repeat protein